LRRTFVRGPSKHDPPLDILPWKGDLSFVLPSDFAGRTCARGWGKPDTYATVSRTDKPIRELTDEELYAILAESDDEPKVDPEQLN
jgi:hypothetical protein